MSCCPNCAILRDKVARLERELGHRHRAGELAEIMTALNVGMATSIIVSILASANGEPVGIERLTNAANLTSVEVARSLISRARLRLGSTSIKCEYRLGYRMTPEGLAAFRAALQPQKEAA